MLQSLDVFGFKSFVDRTRFDFAPGVTGIVGPNGSGKSNVVDAIKWILGDQSPKSMRGKEMTDVIFNGARGRTASGFAEAVLTFDNTSGLLPINSTEVQVGRRIWKNGDSEYLINGSTSRLKDIRDLFMGTGSSAYSIIEQGRVEALLQSNSSNRRLIFEEAAGISRYKSRKAEALRKLERVGQNLLRLTDIVDEVEAQLTSTRNQASKAAKYRDLAEEVKRWWIGLTADDFREHSARLNELDREIGDFQVQIEQLKQQQSDREDGLSSIDGDIVTLREEIREIEQRRSAQREQIAGLEATVAHQCQRRKEFERDRLALIALQTQLQVRLQQAEAIQHDAEQELSEFDEQFRRSQQTRDAHLQEVQGLDSTLEKIGEELKGTRENEFEMARRVAACREKVSALDARLGTLETDRDECAARLDDVNKRQADCRQEHELRQARVNEGQRELDDVETRFDEVRARREELLLQQDEFVQDLAKKRERRSGHEARISVLEELERRQEGLGLSVREILERARSSPHAPWNLIQGSVADLLHVNLEQAPLVDVALGARAQWIVLKQVDPLAEYLVEGTGRLADRVGFLAADAPCQPATDSTRDLSEHPGVVGPLREGVQAVAGTEWLLERLLSDTWVVESLPVALRLARGPGLGARFVTLQGELLEGNGTLLAGTLSSEASPLSRKSELRQLKQELQDLTQQIDEAGSRLDHLDESLVTSDSELLEAETRRQASIERVTRLRADAEDQRRTLEGLQREYEGVQNENQRLDSLFQQTRTEIEAAGTQLTTSEEQLEQLGQRAKEIETTLEGAREQRQQQDAALDQARLEVTRQEERRRNLSEVHEHRRTDVRGQLEQFQETRRRLGQLLEQQQHSDLEVLNSRSRLWELALVDEQQGRLIAQQRAGLNDRKQQREELASEHGRLNEEGQDIRQQQHDEELKAREIRFQLKALDERLQDEYQISLETLEDSRASAFQLYLAELLGTDDEMETEDDPDHTEEEGSLADLVEDAADEEQDETDDTQLFTLESETAPETEPPNESTAILEPPPGVTFASVRDELETRVNRLRKRLKLMGSVNIDALDDLDELETRFLYLDNQRQDLTEAKTTLEEIVQRINDESQRLFHESFELIREHFQELFRKLFGGGEGDIILEDPDDVLDCAIDIVARPPGKELRSITLLSGGEKTLTAVALLMAIFKSRPSPFCVLDEVDAALDEANIDRYSNMIRDFSETTQFIMITHSKRTMVMADLLYGVTMEESGISKRLSVNFEDLSEDGGFTEGPPDDESDAA